MGGFQVLVRARTVLWVLLLPLWLIGCASVGIITDQTQSLGTDEAIVLVRISAPEGRVILSDGGFDDIYNAPLSEAMRTITLKDGDNLVVLRVKKGQKYRFGRYYMRGFSQVVVSFNKSPIAFEPSPETMTYIGDIVIDPKFSSKAYEGVRLGLEDREAETIAQLRQKYPVLFEKYQYKKLLASRVQQ